MALFGKKFDNNNEIPDNGNQAENTENESVQEAESEPEQKKQTFEKLPDNFDFNRYFLAERRIVLENVSYESQRPSQGQLKLTPRDTIVAQVMGQAGVKVTFNRALRFEPEGPFTLSVTFGVMLVFNPGTKGEIDWHRIDFAAEFKKKCPELVGTMAAKSALLVAEITNASGVSPIIIR